MDGAVEYDKKDIDCEGHPSSVTAGVSLEGLGIPSTRSHPVPGWHLLSPVSRSAAVGGVLSESPGVPPSTAVQQALSPSPSRYHCLQVCVSQAFGNWPVHT